VVPFSQNRKLRHDRQVLEKLIDEKEKSLSIEIKAKAQENIALIYHTQAVVSAKLKEHSGSADRYLSEPWKNLFQTLEMRRGRRVYEF